MPTVTVRLPTEALLDLPPAFLATLVNPRRLRALLNDMSDEEIAHLFGEDVEEPVVEPAPLVPPVLQKRRGRKPKGYGAGVDSPADMEPFDPGPPKMTRKRKLGEPEAVDAATMGHVIGALSAEWTDIERIAAMASTSYEVAGRALAIAKANGRAFVRTHPESLAVEYRDASAGA